MSYRTFTPSWPSGRCIQKEQNQDNRLSLTAEFGRGYNRISSEYNSNDNLHLLENVIISALASVWLEPKNR
jgi:hypothetical protein